MTEAMDEVLGAGVADKRHQRVERGADQRSQGAGLGMDFVGGPGADEADEPRGDRRQVAPAQRQRPHRVEQPARHVPHHARHRHRRHRGGIEGTGIAKRRTMPRLGRLDDKDAVAIALQIARHAHPHHAGPDHADPPGPVRRHRFSPEIAEE
jgi:hypothetical protein